ncbi:right-handed parallel beta-helix repeat-containing protein [Ornithinibacillus xuwenensis]|uniref:Right-handed parallel beta-helix repeat-containing protein n=1 Tax=Ornithinibacillus xuwenensis TaxID=3144668 RepID=A0ABU9XDC1_9BACI
MKKMIVIVLTAVAAITAVIILNNTDAKADKVIYVALNGDDENNGTKSKPFRTLEKAASVAQAGTTVYIREGTYHEKLVVKHSGTDSNPIIFSAYQDEKVVISGSNHTESDGDTALITIDDKNNISIFGLSIQDLSTNLSDETVIGIYVTGSSSHITLENNHVHGITTNSENGNGHGIAIYGTGEMNDINIVNNIVEELKLGSSEAIVLNGNINGFTVNGNTVRRSDNIGIDMIGYEGISKDKEHDFVRNGMVKDNDVYEISSFGNPAYGEEYSAAGIYVDGGKNISIEGNTVYKNDIGIEATSEHSGKSADNITITNNVVYHNYYTGISIGGYDENRGGTKNTTIAHNIMYRNDTEGLEGGQLLLQYNTQYNSIEGNILTAGPSRIFIANYFTANKENELKNNVFHSEEGKEGIWVWKDEEYRSFSEFLEASNGDESSRYIDPEYRNEKTFDFDLIEDSPAKEIIE